MTAHAFLDGLAFSELLQWKSSLDSVQISMTQVELMIIVRYLEKNVQGITAPWSWNLVAIFPAS